MKEKKTTESLLSVTPHALNNEQHRSVKLLTSCVSRSAKNAVLCNAPLLCPCPLFTHSTRISLSLFRSRTHTQFPLHPLQPTRSCEWERASVASTVSGASPERTVSDLLISCNINGGIVGIVHKTITALKH